MFQTDYVDQSHDQGMQGWLSTSELGDLHNQGRAMAIWVSKLGHHMKTVSNGNIFNVTGHLCGEFTVHRWIPLTQPSDAELWCFLSSAPD